MTQSSRPFDLSIEVFPPRDLITSFDLWKAIETFSTLDPNFISVTYGAGGSTRANTTQALEAISRKYGVEVAGHLTCVGGSRDKTLSVAQDYWNAGARRMVALRGDVPRQGGHDAEEFKDPIELMSALNQLHNFKFYVAAYPSSHPRAANGSACIDFLKQKFDAGAHAAITQFFFEADDFLRFRDRCVAAGITQKIIPGILPIENWSKTKSFAQKCGVPVPQFLDETFGKADDREVHDLLAVSVGTEMCDTLLDEGVEDLHFYSLNRAALTTKICQALGRGAETKSVKIAS